MNTKFKRHEQVRLKYAPNVEYVEYHTEASEAIEEPIVKGMTGEVNTLLPNGQYHVRIFNKAGEELAYVIMDEDSLESMNSKIIKKHDGVEDIDKELVDMHNQKKK